MGLDVVEFVMEVEDRFDIAIPDDAAAHLKTVGDTVALLQRSLDGPIHGPCASMIAFHRIRAALRERGVPRASCRPDAALRALMPEPAWKRDWSRLERDTDLRFPPLQASVRTRANEAVETVVAGSALAWGWRLWPGVTLHSPPPNLTLGELCHSVVAHNYGRLVRAGARWRQTEAFKIVREVVAAQYGLPLESISPETPLDPDVR